MGKSKAPPAPDYAAAAKQQGQDNLVAAQQTAALNRPTQIDPNGSQTWSLREGADPKNPQAGDWIVTTKLNPTQQALKDQQDALSSQFGNLASSALSTIGDTMGQKFDISGLPRSYELSNVGSPSMITGVNGQRVSTTQAPTAQMVAPLGNTQYMTGSTPDLGAAPEVPLNRTFLSKEGLSDWGKVDPTTEASRQRITDALYNRQTALLNPQTQQQNSDLTARLAAQGITEGSPAYNRAMDNQARQQAEAYQAARDAAILAGGAEDTRIGNQNLNVAQFANATRGQQLAENHTIAGFNNNNLDKTFEQKMAAAGFNRESSQMSFQNQMALKGFNNNAGTIDFQQQLQSATANNGANLANAQFKAGNDLATAGFNNAQDLSEMSARNNARSQFFGEQQAMTTANNTLHNNAVTEALMLRQLPMNEANALRTGNQVGTPAFQQYGGAGQVQAGDYQGAVQNQYNAALAANNANNAGISNTWNGLTGLATAGINNIKPLTALFSDRRLKTQIKRVGTHTLGIGFYEWVYIWGEKARGVMAQEVLTVKPEAVITMPNGFYAVDYKVLGA